MHNSKKCGFSFFHILKDSDKDFYKTWFVASLPSYRFHLKALIDFFKLMVLNPLGLYPLDDKYKWFCIKISAKPERKFGLLQRKSKLVKKEPFK